MNENDTSLKRILCFGLIPLMIAALLYIVLSLCIYISRWYADWHLSKQLNIVRCSERCLIVLNPLLEENEYELYPQAV